MLTLSYLGLVINYADLFFCETSAHFFTVCSKNGPALFFMCTLVFIFNLKKKQFTITFRPGLPQRRERFSCFRGLTYKTKMKDLRVGV